MRARVQGRERRLEHGQKRGHAGDVMPPREVQADGGARAEWAHPQSVGGNGADLGDEKQPTELPSRLNLERAQRPECRHRVRPRHKVLRLELIALGRGVALRSKVR